MGYECDACGATFNTLSKKRLHDCDGVSVATQHDVPSDLQPVLDVLPETVVGFPDGLLTMEQAAGLDDDPSLVRFFPILAEGEPGIVEKWRVAIGYANTGESHVLVGYHGDRGEWVVIAENRSEGVFEHETEELSYWIVENTTVSPFDVVGYDSSSPDYPEFA